MLFRSLVNCAPPEDITSALERLRSFCSLPFGGFAHVGRFSPPSWKFEFFPQFIETDQWPPERYAGEARAALAAGRAVGLPVWVSFVLGPEGELLSREPLAQGVAKMERGGADAVLVNCAPPEDIDRKSTRLNSSHIQKSRMPSSA